MWRRVEPHFRAGATTVLFDLVGAGRSDTAAWSAERYASLQGHADDVNALCEALQLGPVVFVGHSVSAMIGALAARARPDLYAHLVMVCPSPRYIDDGAYRGGFEARDIDELLDLLDINHLEWSAAISPVLMPESERAEEWVQSFCETDPAISRHFGRVVFTSDHRADLPEVGTPTLVLDCTLDALSPPDVGDYVTRALPRAERITLDAAGHCPHVTHPEATVAAIRRYLAPTLSVAA